MEYQIWMIWGEGVKNLVEFSFWISAYTKESFESIYSRVDTWHQCQVLWNVPQKMSLVDRKSSCTLDIDVKCPPGIFVNFTICRSVFRGVDPILFQHLSICRYKKKLKIITGIFPAYVSDPVPHHCWLSGFDLYY